MEDEIFECEDYGYDLYINSLIDKMKEDKYIPLDEAMEFEENHIIGQAENN